jgi:nucleotide-binding universal stress UspA family protein
MYQTILVPLDGSKRAEAILRHVEALARRFGAQVVLLSVVEPIYPNIGTQAALGAHYEQCYEDRGEEARSYLSMECRRLRAKGIDARVDVSYGPVVGAILAAAERVEADLIAMASHGRSGLSQVFYGSVAAGVLHRIDRPLLLIRSHDED